LGGWSHGGKGKGIERKRLVWQSVSLFHTRELIFTMEDNTDSSQSSDSLSSSSSDEQPSSFKKTKDTKSTPSVKRKTLKPQRNEDMVINHPCLQYHVVSLLFLTLAAQKSCLH